MCGVTITRFFGKLQLKNHAGSGQRGHKEDIGQYLHTVDVNLGPLCQNLSERLLLKVAEATGTSS